MPVEDSAALAVGLIGNEGMFGIPLVLGVDVSPVRAVIHGAGSALRMDAAPFCRELRRSPALQREIDHHVFVHEMTPYERLLGDALRGDASLFTSGDCVEAAWRVVDPILGNVTPVAEYKPNSWPPAAEPIVGGHDS
jgi:hypothetical protein